MTDGTDPQTTTSAPVSPKRQSLDEILSGLTEPQLEAVTHMDGPMLVVAGAGSGKTRVVTRRVAHLIHNGVYPSRILAMTFTNKAAGEMKERVAQLTGEAPRWIGTFHSICARMLRYDLDKLAEGRDGRFSILDDDDQTSLFRELIKKRNLEDSRFKPKTVRERISRAKSDLIPPADFGQGSYEDEVICHLYEDYEKRLRQMNALDFDDLLVLAVRMLKHVPGLKEVYHDRFRYLLIDEYQDTNRTQYELMRLLTGPSRNVHVTGDPDQSIYSWRGADYRNIMDFQKDFPGARVVRLEQNYRSTKTILAAANRVIRNNRERIDKDLFTENEAGEKIRAACLQSDRDEANWILGQIRDLRAAGHPLKNVAIFYRTNAQSRSLEEAFVSAAVPYQLVGGVRFYQRREVKDFLAHLKVLVNPRDAVSLRRLTGCRPTGVGEKTLDGIIEQSAARELPPFTFLCDPHFSSVFAGRSSKKLKEFAAWCRMLDETPRKPVQDCVRAALTVSGLCEHLRVDDPETADERIDNLMSFLQRAEEFGYANPDADLAAFLEDVALVADIDGFNENTDAATLMTLHSAKGLEFPYVFIAGMENGLLPHENAQTEFQQEEERRLFYVGLTRARQRAYLSYAVTRMTHGRFAANAPSLFLQELPPEVVETEMRAQPMGANLFPSDDLGGGDVWGDWDDPFGGSSSLRAKPRAATGGRTPRFGTRPGASLGGSWKRKGSADPDADGGLDLGDDLLFGDEVQAHPDELPGIASGSARGQASAGASGGGLAARGGESGAAFRSGDLVEHPTFGKGKVLSSSRVKVIVQFFVGGVKSLQTASCRLRRL